MAIEYCWKRSGREGGTAVRDIINRSTYKSGDTTISALDTYFYQQQGEKKVTGAAIDERTEAYMKADEIVTSKTLNIGPSVPTVTYSGGNAYIGPLVVNYAGGTLSIQVYNGTSWVSASGWATRNSNGTFNTTNSKTSEITTGGTFYAVIGENSVNNLNNVNVKAILTYNTYEARVFLGTNKLETGQNLMFFSGKTGQGSKDASWASIPQIKSVSIQKKYANGNNINVSGIEFKIYDSNDNYKGTLTTDANGKTNSIDLSANTQYKIKETTNTMYGYKNAYISSASITSGAGTINASEGDATFTLNGTKDATISITNAKDVGKLIIEKKNQAGNVQTGVKFTLYKAGHDIAGYMILKKNGQAISNNEIKNSIDITSYEVEYTTDELKATKFTTDANGKIQIDNLEKYAKKWTLYNYYIREIENPSYGYKGLRVSAKYAGGNALSIDEKGYVLFTLSNSDITTIEVTNQPIFSTLEITKRDDFNENILLPNVGFAVEIKASNLGGYNYLALYDKNGNVVRSKKDNVTINLQNIANETEYRMGYYHTNKSYKQLTATEKQNITEFITGDDGILTINNIEVYTINSTEKYKYKLIETSNGNYGYDVEAVEVDNIEPVVDGTKTQKVLNTSILTKISGYVWVDELDSKANIYNGRYNDNEKKLKDLYTINKDGKLVKDTEAEIPVEIKLRNKVNGEILKSLPDEFDRQTGKYTFVDVELEKLTNYEVIFMYDGFYYTTLVPQLNENNASKVKEIPATRESLNEKFAKVEEGNKVISTNNVNGQITYDKDENEDKDKNLHTSEVTSLSFNTTVAASTGEAGYDIKDVYDNIKRNSTVPIETVENVNMGIVLREQPKLALGSDIYSVYIKVNGKGYTYNYNGRQKHYDNLHNDPIGVKFEQENNKNRYTRTVYSSDVQALNDGVTTIEMKITYKIQLTNQAATLTSKIYQIKNYYDSRYTLEAIGATYDEVNPAKQPILGNTTDVFTVVRTEENIEVELGEGLESIDAGYKSATININGDTGTELKAKARKDVYIRFDVSTEAIKKLLNNSSTYHNATEILSYSTYYGSNTANFMNMTDKTEAGKIYAGIDKTSQPGNINLKLIKQGQGIPVLDASEFEDDTASAPSLLLVAEESRKISGTVWEDATQYTDKTGRLGDGRFENGEKLISGVKVTLHKLKADGTAGDVATYSDGETLAETVTDKNGNYTLGYYDEQSKKYLGILPSKYIIKYTYGTIANEETEEEIKSYIIISNEESKYVNANDYKSTIITSKVVEEAFNKSGDLRWYLRSDENKIRYSDARDDINLRNEYKKDESKYTIKNSNYNELYNTFMIAYTPCMEVPVEYTKEDESSALIEKNSLLEMARLEKELKQLDFGIAERACTDIKIDKNITGLEIVSQTGASIVSKGNPSDLNSIMQHVKKLDDLVSVEIESDMLQGAQLNLEYSITVTNDSEIDYLDKEYYYYGRNPRTPTSTKVKKVIDYLDSTLIFDEEKDKDGIWKQVTTDELSGYVEYNIIEKLKKEGEQTAFITDAFDGLNREEKTRTFKLYATKSLATTNNLVESNGAEIIEIYGVRIITSSIPGNYNPAFDDYEIDEDKVDLIITPPTGTTTNYSIYIIAAIATFAILILGIVIIKKKIIK